jgi:hypothetical protein
MQGRNTDMNPLERVGPANPRANLIWRFFSDSTRHWSWQQLAFDGTVVEHSKSGYLQYEACVANASEHGYKSFPALSTKASSTSPKVTRSPTRLTAGNQKRVSEIIPVALEPKEDIPTDDSLDGD